MSEREDLLHPLRKQLDICTYRIKILKFQVLSHRLNGRLSFVLNKDKCFHLNNCVWSLDDATEGPDTCHCCMLNKSLKEFFEYSMNHPSEHFKAQVQEKQSESLTKRLPRADEDEDITDFYLYRILDKDNIAKWYEAYKMKKNVLQFRLKMRELNKENEIDAVYNNGEWHLTDCIRSIKSTEGPDVCHCQFAMMDPMKYLQDRYNYFDLTEVLEKIKSKKLPTKYV